MNCDQAFDYLTDSTRRDSDALARHLAGCTRCRQLKETLEPALGLFDELVPEPANGSLEESPRAAADDSVRIAKQSAARLSQRRHSLTASIRSAVRYAAAFLIGAAVVYTAMPEDAGDDAAPAGSICPWQNRAHADDSGLNAERVVLSCVDCHMAPSSSENTTTLNLDILGRSFVLAMPSRDRSSASQISRLNGLFVMATLEAAT